MKTLNQLIQYFHDFAVGPNGTSGHLQLNDFGFGNLFEINGEIKPGITYNLLWVIPVDSETTEQTKRRRFLFMCLGLVKEDLSNRDEVWSDTEQILDDLFKKILVEEEDIDLGGDPLMTPVSERFGDWVTGWQADVVIETKADSTPCNIPEE